MSTIEMLEYSFCALMGTLGAGVLGGWLLFF
jgi:hypothetical protein